MGSEVGVGIEIHWFEGILREILIIFENGTFNLLISGNHARLSMYKL